MVRSEGKEPSRKLTAENGLLSRSVCQPLYELGKRMGVSARCSRVSPVNKTSLRCFLYPVMEEDWW